ncbi:helix-turn-helix transcriptional regulator [Segetibacter koreensis]|uniref:helix-turn-helix transcriptional regulator n=1 Tax=Segetibacter koreensis TaxID=398037 RepID=UPI00036F63C7|nr:AraC family transcriptional regulator [Segetibacter koreensis]
MNQFVLQQGCSRELQMFPHIIEFGVKKNISIQLDSLPDTTVDNIRIYYIMDGKFEWNIHERQYILYPGDIAFILPNERFGGTKGFLEIGTLSWIHINAQKPENGKMQFGNWSRLSENETQMIGKILLLNKSVVLERLSEASRIFVSLQSELFNHEIGYHTRVNQLLDELLIIITRRLTRQTNSGRDFSKNFLQLEQKLREDLSHQWTVEEMAATVGMGTTLFNERVKSYSGFSPLNYLINIRISEAIKLLKKPDLNVTDIALDTGFYSSQHFSTTFKKLTGYTPSEFRKKNIS